MLYSESVERHRRFKTALKISFPFFIFLALYIFIFKIIDLGNDDFFLLVFFVIVYIYYIFYMIYQSFKISILDNRTKAFGSEAIIKEIKKALHVRNKKDGFVVMIFIKNITFIEEQYDVDTRNDVLKKFVQKLQRFLISKNFKNVPIGRYQSANFLLLFKNQENKKFIGHLINEFCIKINNSGIDDIEINLQNSIVSLSYDKNVENIISKLINLPNEEKERLNVLIKPDKFDILIKKAIKKRNFIHTYQFIRHFANKGKVEFMSVNSKLDIENFGYLNKNQISKSIKKNSYEIVFDLLAIRTTLDEIQDILKEKEDLKLVVKISPVSFRNSNFLIQLLEILRINNISASKICFCVTENKLFEDINKFREIVKKYKNSGFFLIFNEFGLNNVGIIYLKENFEFDIFTFDLELTKNLDKKTNYEIVKALANMCKKLGKRTLIKFVDKQETEDRLKDIKPDLVQGFLFDKPKTIDQIIEGKDEIW